MGVCVLEIYCSGNILCGDSIILDMIGVAVGRNGLRLWENDARRSRKVFRWLRGLWDTINKSKMAAKVQKRKNDVNYRIF